MVLKDAVKIMKEIEGEQERALQLILHSRQREISDDHKATPPASPPAQPRASPSTSTSSSVSPVVANGNGGVGDSKPSPKSKVRRSPSYGKEISMHSMSSREPSVFVPEADKPSHLSLVASSSHSNVSSSPLQMKRHSSKESEDMSFSDALHMMEELEQKREALRATGLIVAGRGLIKIKMNQGWAGMSTCVLQDIRMR